jgi:hypothetical protein
MKTCRNIFKSRHLACSIQLNKVAIYKMLEVTHVCETRATFLLSAMAVIAQLISNRTV